LRKKEEKLPHHAKEWLAAVFDWLLRNSSDVSTEKGKKKNY